MAPVYGTDLKNGTAFHRGVQKGYQTTLQY